MRLGLRSRLVPGHHLRNRPRWLLVGGALLGAPALAAQGSVPPQMRAVAGCWTVAVGAYSPALDFRADWAALPPLILVDTVPGLNSFDQPSGWRIGTPSGPGAAAGGGGALHVAGADSVVINWGHSGSGGVRLELRTSRDSMHGVADAWTDAVTSSKAPVRLMRTACPAREESTGPGVVHAQWPDDSTMYRQVVRHRWMNARQSPAFTRWTESQPTIRFDSARTGTGGATTLHFTPRFSRAPGPMTLELRAEASGHVTPGALVGIHSAMVWDLVPSFRPPALRPGARWVDTVDVPSTQPELTTRLRGIRVSRLIRDSMVTGRRAWLVRDTLHGSYHEVATSGERTQFADVTIERNAEGMLVGEYLIEPDSRTVAWRADTASFHGTATLRYPDGRTSSSTTTFEQVRLINGYRRAEYDSLVAEERRTALRFSMFIEPTNDLERRLAGGDITLRDSLLAALDRSRDVDERHALLGSLAMWAGGTGNQPFADTLRAHLLLAGDTALVVIGLMDPLQTPLTPERLSLILPFVRDPGLAFAWGVPADRFHQNVAQRFTAHPPAIPHPTHRQLCTIEACALLASLQDAEGPPRLRQTARLAAFASGPLRWIDSVRDEPAPGGLYNLIHGVGATWRAPYPSMPGSGASWLDWAVWMNGAALPDSVLTGASAPVLRFGEAHANASAFSGLLSGRDIPAEWEVGAAEAGSALERFVFERMLAGRGRWRPDPDSVAVWLNDGTALGWARGELGAPRVLADAPLPDSASATSLIHEILADEVDGEEPWEPRPGASPRTPRQGWGSQGHTIYVVTPMVTEELRRRWTGRATWITDPEWRLGAGEGPAVILRIQGLAARGGVARISVQVSSVRHDSQGAMRTLSGDSYILLRTPTGWRVISADNWMV